jgi:hypothetical protein
MTEKPKRNLFGFLIPGISVIGIISLIAANCGKTKKNPPYL